MRGAGGGVSLQRFSSFFSTFPDSRHTWFQSSFNGTYDYRISYRCERHFILQRYFTPRRSDRLIVDTSIAFFYSEQAWLRLLSISQTETDDMSGMSRQLSLFLAKSGRKKKKNQQRSRSVGRLMNVDRNVCWVNLKPSTIQIFFCFVFYPNLKNLSFTVESLTSLRSI